jgi:DNA-binding response OmpR family regulator
MKPRTPIRFSFRVGPYTVDAHTREVKKGTTPIPLTNTAFSVFYQLVARRGAVVLRKEFEPWGKETHHERLPVDLYIMEIRRQLGESIIDSVRGKGYRLSPRVRAKRRRRSLTHDERR